MADAPKKQDDSWYADTEHVVQQHQVQQHTAMVNTIKSLVLIGIIISLGVLIAWPFFQKDDRFLQLGISEVEVADSDSKPVLVRPRLYGIDASGQPYTITGDEAEQLKGGEVFLNGVDADITLDSGAWMSITSLFGTYWQKKRELELKDNVVLVMDNGYEFETEEAFMDLKIREAVGKKPVAGQGPLGTLTSDEFLVQQGGDEFIFTGNVHVVSYP